MGIARILTLGGMGPAEFRLSADFVPVKARPRTNFSVDTSFSYTSAALIIYVILESIVLSAKSG